MRGEGQGSVRTGVVSFSFRGRWRVSKLRAASHDKPASDALEAVHEQQHGVGKEAGAKHEPERHHRVGQHCRRRRKEGNAEAVGRR